MHSPDTLETSDRRPVILWPESDRLPVLEPGTVHIWGWALDDSSAHDSTAASAPDRAVLSAEENARAGRLLSARHRLRFTAAHVGLRRVLSSYLGVEAGAIAFSTSEHGKPHLDGGSTIRFNLSHSRNIALLAVCDGFDVGVDVEFMRPITDDIAGRFFSSAENAALKALPEEDRLPSFYACWTRKEAFLKGLGTGIGGGLDKFSVTLPGQGTPRLSDDGSHITAGWSVAHLEPALGYVGAVAMKTVPPLVRCFRLEL